MNSLEKHENSINFVFKLFALFIGMPNIAKLPNKSVIIENSLRKLDDIDRKTIQSFVIHVERRVC